MDSVTSISKDEDDKSNVAFQKTIMSIPTPQSLLLDRPPTPLSQPPTITGKFNREEGLNNQTFRNFQTGEGLQPKKQENKKPSVGWVGSIGK